MRLEHCRSLLTVYYTGVGKELQLECIYNTDLINSGSLLTAYYAGEGKELYPERIIIKH